ncbi:hypothetical protein J4404_00555 [Candidatus Woesearchaeota archaeon]|nr:hypothetical protein [Candidatus Woesearchaeota archaeon]
MDGFKFINWASVRKLGISYTACLATLEVDRYIKDKHFESFDNLEKIISFLEDNLLTEEQIDLVYSNSIFKSGDPRQIYFLIHFFEDCYGLPKSEDIPNCIRYIDSKFRYFYEKSSTMIMNSLQGLDNLTDQEKKEVGDFCSNISEYYGSHLRGVVTPPI